MDLTFGQIVLSEFLGTGMLVLLGCGVVANVVLPKNKGFGGGWLLISVGWGLAVFSGVYVAAESGAHINPAVTFGLAAEGTTAWADVPAYLTGEFAGAIAGAAVVFLAYKKQFDAGEEPDTKLAVFSTGPEVRSYGWNVVTEVVGTFVLVFVVLSFGPHPIDLGPLAVGLLVLVIGTSLGGPTGYAINPARDLGPRIAHALLPIPGKGPNDWAYAWVPVVGPIIGGILAGLAGGAVYG
ncbi:aquaporin family protein [Actinobacteria bacterium YIM 96077]|uniref:Aquaporin family protein n=1 Tax=Phytoactinopolyspora halophila TaxID=1981511 RepID=A0A329R466_9ACTN|nr:MIP/aquaporin family protein [Phytoactinopolyspora halophila]AYY11979.1 aquaporin family protein [Actinobacteria bacterium YIM 96077]RAW18786.1 aquaporin family protein [Phytoactinopolyspora halophila]